MTGNSWAAWFGPFLIVLTVGIVFLLLWRNAKKHEQAELARFKQKEQERKRSLELLEQQKRKTKPLSPIVAATPRKATSPKTSVKSSARRPIPAPTYTPTATPAPAPSSDPLLDIAAGYLIGKGIESFLSDDDRPAASPVPSFVSGAGGDFGGGGASSSWDDSSSSSSSLSDSSDSSSNSWD